MKSIVILSGGLDSTTLLHYIVKELKEKVYPVSFIYGQKHSIEIEMAKEQVKILKDEGYNVNDLKIINMDFMNELLKGSSALVDNDIDIPTLEEVLGEPQPITYVPFRNLLFLSIALSYGEAVGAEKVYYGAQRHDEYSGYWDTTLCFVEKVNELVALNRLNKIRIVAPFVNLSKSEEIVIGKKLDIDYGKTWTCYEGMKDGKACGVCATCRDRIMAFVRAGEKDLIPYSVYINWDDLINKYKELDLDDYKNIVQKLEL